MSVALSFPRGSQWSALLRFPVGIDLTGATLTASLKYSPDDADADAIALSTGDDPALLITVVDALAASAQLTFLAAATAGISRLVTPWWQVQATLADGALHIFEQHQGVLYLTPRAASVCGCADFPPQPGITAIIDDTSSIALLPTMLSNVVINRYDLTGLGVSAPGSTKLASLAATTLAQLQSGAILRLYLPGDIMVDYRLRIRGVDTEDFQRRIFCDNDSARLFELVAVPFKARLSSLWDPDLLKWRQQVIAAGSIAIADEADAFVIPD